MSNSFLKYLTVFFILTLSACSYKPIFSEKEYNFEIDEILFSGEKDINKIVSNKLNHIKKDNIKNKKVYNLLINTNKEKIIVSKDSKGDPSKFELKILAVYQIKENDKVLLSRTIEKNSIYNSDTDKFELENKEKMIVENLSDKISDIIISSIINLNDN